MLSERRGNQLLWVASERAVDDDFAFACEHEDIAALDKICSGQERNLLSREIVLWEAINATRMDRSFMLRFIVRNFQDEIDIKNLLATSVSYNSRGCFGFLITLIPVESLQYSSVYEHAIEMQKQHTTSNLHMHVHGN
jgi:hypothetical protein